MVLQFKIKRKKKEIQSIAPPLAVAKAIQEVSKKMRYATCPVCHAIS
jgi:cytochrome c5